VLSVAMGSCANVTPLLAVHAVCKRQSGSQRNRRKNIREQFEKSVHNLLRVVQKGPCRQLLHTMSTMRKGRKSPFWPRYACSIARLVAAWRAPYASLAQGPSFCKGHIVRPLLSFLLIRVWCRCVCVCEWVYVCVLATAPVCFGVRFTP
jgi:hypothetical protein